jgi:hypothetical protein
MNENSNSPKMLTISETSKESGLAKYYIRTLCWQNKIVYIKAGKKYLINYGKFIDYLNAGDAEEIGGVQNASK